VLVVGVLLFALRDTPHLSWDAPTTPNSLNSPPELGPAALAVAIVGMAPAKDFAALVVTNQVGDETSKACDPVASVWSCISLRDQRLKSVKFQAVWQNKSSCANLRESI
jgi:hypothetical protein